MAQISRLDIGLLISRLSLGGFMLLHGIKKMQTGVTMMEPMLTAKGLPAFVSYGVYIGEVLAPLLLILGIWTRPAGIVFAFQMVMAIYLAHSADLFKINEMTGGYALELQMIYLLGGIALALTGPGKLSLSKGKGKLD
jgi:putative oxidoreductase